MLGKKSTGCYKNISGGELVQSGVWCQNRDMASEKPLSFQAHMSHGALPAPALCWAAACCLGCLGMVALAVTPYLNGLHSASISTGQPPMAPKSLPLL